MLHSFNDETAINILNNIATAIGNSGARCAILETVLPETGADLAGTSFDMQMLMGTEGRERTLNEWKAIIQQAGLQLEELVGLQSIGNI